MRIQISNGSVQAEICIRGAELKSLRRDGREYMWSGDPAIWKRTSPLLFPVVGRLKNDCYIWNNQKYNMPLHGIADELLTTVVEQKENSVSLRSIGTFETEIFYPFQFELISSFEIQENQLVVSRKVLNKSKGIMPFCIGEHFGFALSCATEPRGYVLFEKRENTKRFFLNNEHLLYKEEPLICSYIPIEDRILQQRAIIFHRISSSKVRLLDSGNRPLLEVSLGNYSAFAIWSKENSPFVCLEPINGFDSRMFDSEELINKELITILEPGEEKTFASQIRLC